MADDISCKDAAHARLDTFDNPLHGKQITNKELDTIRAELSRAHYVKACAADISVEVDRRLVATKDILFMPNDVYDDMNLQDGAYTRAVYKIIIFGVLEDGRRAAVLLNGIRPYLEVQVPADAHPQQYADTVVDELMAATAEDYTAATGKKAGEYFGIKVAGQEINHGRHFKLFAEQPAAFVRIYFEKLAARRYALQYLAAKGYRVVHDDLNNYYRVVCRDYQISFNVWCRLSKYTKVRDHERIKGLVLSLDIAHYKPYPAELIQTAEHLQKDATMSMCWDCETYKPYSAEDKGVPHYSEPTHRLFMIGATFQWYYAAGDCQLLRICFVDMPTRPYAGYLSIVCGDEKGVIDAFIRVWSWMLPELILGFNDGEYDWPWLRARAEQHGLLRKMAKGLAQVWPSEYGGANPWATQKILYNYYKSSQYKLDADTSITCYKFNFPGSIAIDVRTVFRQLFPNDEASSLNHYLTRLGIPTKLDVNFKDMFDMYAAMLEAQDRGVELAPELLETMQQVAHYCVVDAQRCHELMAKLYVIMDKRAISHMSYVSFQDAIERANGMKVRNLIIAAGQVAPFCLKFNNNAVELAQDDERAKYPGAYVFPPRKGLVNGKLSMAERIAAAHAGDPNFSAWAEISEQEIAQAKSVIAEYGAVLLPEFIAEIEAKASGIVFSRVVRDFLCEEIKRPITGLDFNSLYPSLMMTYNLSPEYMILDKQEAKELATRHTLFPIRFPFKGATVRGWIVRHDNHIDPADPQFKFGIFGYVLKQLFDKRKALKGQMKIWEKRAEDAEEGSAEYIAARFQYEYMNSTQKALKIFMNTFYGEIGNQRSPFFMVQVAGGVTVNGGRNVKLAQKYVEEKGCRVYYGDSVLGDSPLILQTAAGNTIIRTISEIVPDDAWEAFPQFKPYDYGRIDKQQALCGMRIWVDNRWNIIRRVIRHKTKKRIFRVMTRLGCVDVTEDHSLCLAGSLDKIKPCNAVIGTRLHHSFPHKFNSRWYTEYESVAASISCKKPSPSFMTRTMAWWCGRDFRKQHVVDSIQIKSPERRTDSRLFDEIVNSPADIREAFLAGCVGAYATGPITSAIKVFCYGKLHSMELYYIARSLGHYVEVTSLERPFTGCTLADVYSIHIFACGKIADARMADNKSRGHVDNAICELRELYTIDESEYVYDIETSCGRFLTGVGSLTVCNTDSIYTSMPDEYFGEVDKLYFAEKISKYAYWSRLVDITLEVIARLRDEVNAFFCEDNGTRFLTMAFEEVLFPVLFASKKKYVGIAHEHHPSFAAPLDIGALTSKYKEEIAAKFPEYTVDQIQNAADDMLIARRKKQFFIRGLDVVKRGMPNFAKEIVLDILEEMVAIGNCRELLDIVADKIRHIYSRKWDEPHLMYKFVMTDQYKPHKKNQKMHVFVARMAELYNITIKPFERVRYIIAAKYPYRYDIRGRQVPLSVGEKMELADVALEREISIDIDEYMQSKVHGQLGRLVAYRAEFLPTNAADVDMTDAEEVKGMEDAIYKAAMKWVEARCAAESDGKYCKLGPIYQTISKAAIAASYWAIGSSFAVGGDTAYKRLFVPKVADELDELPEWLIARVQSAAKAKTRTYGKIFIKDIEKAVAQYAKVHHWGKDEYLAKRGVARPQKYDSLVHYVRTKLAKVINVTLPSATRIYELQHRKYVNELQVNIHHIRTVYCQFNTMVKNASEYICENAIELAQLHQSGITDETMRECQARIAKFVECHHSIILETANGIIQDESNNSHQIRKALGLMNTIYVKMMANCISLYKIQNIVEVLAKAKDKTVGHINVQINERDITSMVNDIIAKI